jgi:hypothetical protein
MSVEYVRRRKDTVDASISSSDAIRGHDRPHVAWHRVDHRQIVVCPLQRQRPKPREPLVSGGCPDHFGDAIIDLMSRS